MGKKVIVVGDPKSDGDYILYGFSAGWTRERMTFRLGNVLAAVRLPLMPDQENRITWRIKVPVSQRIHFRIGDEELYCASLSEPDRWEAVSFKVPPERSRGWTEVQLACDNFVLQSRTEACFALAEVVIEAEGEKWPELARPKADTTGMQLLFGDLHIHTRLSWCGGERNGTPEENLRFCKEVRHHDFAAVTDHAEHLVKDKTWEGLCKVLDSFNEEGKFVTMPAYEWTSDLYGHRNVYLAEPYERIFHCMDPTSSSPPKLWASLEEEGQNAITIPHHPIRREFPMRWDEHDPKWQPAVEMCSIWGSSEYYGNELQEIAYSEPGISVRDALTKGLRLGFVGGSDGHDRVPGTGGLTGVFVREFSRRGILEAIRSRHCYATTGVPIRLYVILNNCLMMGDEWEINQYQFEGLYPLLFHISVEGTAPIETVELFECNELVASYRSSATGSMLRSPYWDAGEFLRVDRRADEQVCVEFVIPHWERYYTSWKPRERLGIDPRVPNHSTFYYVRVTQKDGHRAWSSPIWLLCRVGECERVKGYQPV